MSNIIWIIVIGFVAGLIARFVSPGPNGRQALFSQLFSELSAHLLQPLLASSSAGINSIKARVLSARPLAQ